MNEPNRSQYCTYHIYTGSLRHRKCGVRGYMHELFVLKTRMSEVRARYERVRAFDTKNECI